MKPIRASALAIAVLLLGGLKLAGQSCNQHCPASQRDKQGCCVKKPKPKTAVASTPAAKQKAPASAATHKRITRAKINPGISTPHSSAPAVPLATVTAEPDGSVPAPAASAAQSAAEVPADSGPQTQPGDFVNYADLDREPMQKSKPDPVIPATASNRTLNGLISVTVAINERGEVEDAVLLHGMSPDYGLNAACVEAARQMRFSSPIKGGVPVKTKKTVTYKFTN